MSRAPIDPQAKVAISEWRKNENATLDTLLKEGRSFSGRERNCCFLNTGGKRFANISTCAGLNAIDDSRAIAVVDWDHDGDLDLWMTNRTGPKIRFFRNDAPSANHFVAFRLQGNGVSTNRDAIGAIVEVVVKDDPLKRIKTLYGGSGFQSQSSKCLTFGLGDVESIDHVLVSWPSGATEQFDGAAVDGCFQLVQGTGQAELWKSPEREVQLYAKPTAIPPAEPGSRTFLVSRYPCPRLVYEDFQGQSQEVFRRRSGQPVLVNLWASWCVPCRVELEEFAEQAARIKQAGLDIVALNVDHLSANQGVDEAVVQQILEKMHFSFPGGKATHAIRSRIQFVHDSVLGLHEPLPAPMSMLIDGDGYVSAMYKGRVDVDQLLQDVADIDSDLVQRRELAQPAQGRWLAEPVQRELVVIAENFRNLGYMDDAADVQRDILLANPDDPNANYYLGRYFLGRGQPSQALDHLRRSQQVKPHASTRSYLAVALQQLGQSTEALLQSEHAIAEAPDDLPIQLNHASILARARRLDEAIAVLELTTKSRPEAAEAFVMRGGFMEQVGRGNEALEVYKKGLQLNPDNVVLIEAAASFLAAQQRYTEAIQYFEHALAIDPNSPSLQESLQRARRRLNPEEPR